MIKISDSGKDGDVVIFVLEDIQMKLLHYLDVNDNFEFTEILVNNNLLKDPVSIANAI